MAVNILGALGERPIIPAIRQQRDLHEALASPAGVVFLLAATVFNLPEACAQAKGAGKIFFVHLDMIQGLSKDAFGVQWVAQQAKPSGIITTRAHLVGEARSHSLLVIQRTFLLDSQSVHTGVEMVKDARPDVLEILPGIVPSEIQDIARRVPVPVIAGGLIKTRSQCIAALRAGAAGVSTSHRELWAADIPEFTAPDARRPKGH